MTSADNAAGIGLTPGLRIFDIHRMSTHDGPGMRTTVFVKGCSLHCPWCHNPESIDVRPEPWWLAHTCIACGKCVEACPNDAVTLGPRGVEIDRLRCDRVGSCAKECPTGAIKMVGRTASVDELVSLAARDRIFYANSGGGVTVSGGEPLLQAAGVAALAGRLRAAGIHVAVDTAGAVSQDALTDVLPTVDLVLLDIKTLDKQKASTLLGPASRRVRAFARALADGARAGGRPDVWIRTPIVPGATDDPSTIKTIARFINAEMEGVVSRWELCAFNPLGAEKYSRLGQTWVYKDADLVSAELLERLRRIGRELVGDSVAVVATGLTSQQGATPD